MGKYSKNFITRISFDDYHGILRMVDKDFIKQTGGIVGSRIFTNINQEDFNRLNKIHGNNGNSDIITFDDQKQVYMTKNIVINLYTYIKSETGGVVKDHVIHHDIVFEEDTVKIDCIMESWNDSVSYLNSLFIMYNELFNRFFTKAQAEALAVLSTSFRCEYNYNKLLYAFFDENDSDLLFNSHNTNETLKQLLTETNNLLETFDKSCIRNIYKNFIEEY